MKLHLIFKIEKIGIVCIFKKLGDDYFLNSRVYYIAKELNFNFLNSTITNHPWSFDAFETLLKQYNFK
jgi:hypothetical protein